MKITSDETASKEGLVIKLIIVPLVNSLTLSPQDGGVCDSSERVPQEHCGSSSLCLLLTRGGYCLFVLLILKFIFRFLHKKLETALESFSSLISS